MKIGMATISAGLLLFVTGTMTFAAQPTPPAKDRGVGPSSITSGTPTTKDQGQGPSFTPGAPTKDQGQGRPDNKGAASLGKRHAAAGTIQSLNAGSKSFDLATNQGTLHMLTDASARFQVKGKHNATFADLSNGDKANVQGTTDGTNLTAKFVHVIPGNPSISHAVGQVVSFTAASGSTAGSITVKDRSGVNRTFVVNGDTKIRPKDATVSVGDFVTVVGTKGTPSTAKGIVVQKKQG